MHNKKFIIFLKIWVQYRVGAIPRLPLFLSKIVIFRHWIVWKILMKKQIYLILGNIISLLFNKFIQK